MWPRPTGIWAWLHRLWPGRFWTTVPGQLRPEPPFRGDPMAAPGTTPPSPRTRTPRHSLKKGKRPYLSGHFGATKLSE